MIKDTLSSDRERALIAGHYVFSHRNVEIKAETQT